MRCNKHLIRVYKIHNKAMPVYLEGVLPVDGMQIDFFCWAAHGVIILKGSKAGLGWKQGRAPRIKEPVQADKVAGNIRQDKSTFGY